MPRSGNLFLRSLRALATRDSACVIPSDYAPTQNARRGAKGLCWVTNRSCCCQEPVYQLRVPYFVVDKLQNKCLFEWPRLVYLAVG